MFIQNNPNELIVCKVSPLNVQYGDNGCPIYTFYNDGTVSSQQGVGYFRTSGLKLRKPAREFSIQEFQNFVDGKITINHFLA